MIAQASSPAERQADPPTRGGVALKKLLLLGGTAEASTLAHKLDGLDVQVITSLAGRTRQPNAPPGEIRIGGFGGVDGLERYLRDEAIDVLIDATHPFADTMGEHARVAADRVSVPRLRLIRPPWEKRPGDRWIDAVDTVDAAKALPGLARRVFLTSGHHDLKAFADLDDIWFLIRTIEPVKGRLPKQIERLETRGPFSEANELALLEHHQIDAIVTKASGGDATYAKIEAARTLGLPVIMIQRPPPPPGPIAEDTNAALTWLRQVTA